MEIIVVPAYGRDYQTKEQVLVDWNSEKDFIINDLSNRWNGKYINRQQTTTKERIKVRFNKRQDVVWLNGGTPGTILYSDE